MTFDFGYVYTGDESIYRFSANPNVQDSGCPTPRESSTGEKIAAYLKNDSTKGFDKWTDTHYEKLNIEKQINEYEKYLADTDYCVIKCNELGLDIATEYPEQHAKRAEARAAIDELRKELENL